MRLAVRALVLLTLPVLAFGWLTTAQLLPGPPDFERAFAPHPTGVAIMFLAAAAASAVAGSIVLTLADFIRGFRASAQPAPPRPIALPVVVLSALAGLGTLSMKGSYLEASEMAVVWLAVVVITAAGFAMLLVAVMLVRALIGLWAMPELGLWPGRRAATIVLMVAALAAVPVGDGQPTEYDWFGGLESTTLVPLAERMRVELTGQPGREALRYSSYEGGL